jgi:hypothetical protein
MKNLYRTKLLFVVLTMPIVFSACSSRPSDEKIKTGIIEYLQKEGAPPSWAGSLLGGKDVDVDLIDIEQIGNYNKDAKYWPIKARVKGTCKADLLVSRESRNFDRVGDFQLYQDDYGNWKARLNQSF